MYNFEIKKEIIVNTLKGPAKGGIYEKTHNYFYFIFWLYAAVF